MKLIITIIMSVMLGVQGTAQYTIIPDSSFELYLVNQEIDTDGIVNGQVLTSDISDESELIIFGLQIEDLTGIEDFASLEILSLTSMNITSLDLSNNFDLRSLSIDWLNLEGLDISANIDLVNIFLSFQNDTSLNMIVQIDISNNLLLEKLIISGGFIASVDASNNNLIDQFELHQMTELESINLRNANNENIAFLRIQGNPNLQCVQVDDPEAVIAGVVPPYDNWIIENNPMITDDCQLGVQDDLSNAISIFPNPASDIVHIDNNSSIVIESIHIYSLLGERVVSQTGKSNKIDVSRLRSGVYFLKIGTSRGDVTKKIIKN